MKPLNAMTARVRQELREVNVTAFGRTKFASRFLPKILHEDEHIKAAVYGRYGADDGPNWNEGMLVATDHRILFLDRKPGFDTVDELTYDIISGVKKVRSWPFASMTLHTRIKDYTIRFANQRCIDTFMRYVEVRRLEPVNYYGTRNWFVHDQPKSTEPTLNEATLDFMNQHDLGTLSTVDYYGNAHGASVHYLVSPNQEIHIISRTSSKKVQNIFTHRQVALTITDESTLQSLQLRCEAEVESDQYVKSKALSILTRPRPYGEKMQSPPVTAIHSGEYIVLRLHPYSAKLSTFKQS